MGEAPKRSRIDIAHEDYEALRKIAEHGQAKVTWLVAQILKDYLGVDSTSDTVANAMRKAYLREVGVHRLAEALEKDAKREHNRL